MPALIDALKDHETMVKVVAAHGLGTLGSYSKAAVTPLVTALPGELEATARAAFLEALEAIAPGSLPLLDAHRNGLHDPVSQVRRIFAHSGIIRSTLAGSETARTETNAMNACVSRNQRKMDKL